MMTGHVHVLHPGWAFSQLEDDNDDDDKSGDDDNDEESSDDDNDVDEGDGDGEGDGNSGGTQQSNIPRKRRRDGRGVR